MQEHEILIRQRESNELARRSSRQKADKLAESTTLRTTSI